MRKAVNEPDPDTRRPYPCFALLGEPGAGKSTVLRQLALTKTRERLNDVNLLLPLFVNLGAHESGTPRDFLRAHWRERLGDDGFDAALKAGGVWLFADGLNEMPREGYDERVRQWRDFFHRDFPAGNRAVIACRTADYGNGLDLPRLSILPMDAERIQEFARKRLPDLADALWRDLRGDRGSRLEGSRLEGAPTAGFRPGRADLYRLARNPFWLTALIAAGLSKGAARQARLADADIQLAQLRTLLRLCVDLKLLTPRQYEHAAEIVAEVGWLLGGWLKQPTG